MKRSAYSRWSPIPILALLVLTTLPLPIRAQTGEVREKQEKALRLLEERLAQVREELARAGEPDAEARARYRQAMAELEEFRAAELREVQERAQLVAEERAARTQILVELSEARQADLLDQAREREAERRARVESLQQERRIHAEDARRRAEELAVRVRERTEAQRARLAERIRDAQQVRVRIRARARLGVGLDGAQGEEYDRQGALVNDVMEDSPADQAGLQEGDIITHLDGQSLLAPIPGEDELEFGEETSLPVQRLMALARELEDGQEVEVRYLRDGNPEAVTLEAAEMDDRWVTVMPGDFEGRIFNLDPEGMLRWRYDFPERDFELLIEPGLRSLRDLDIEIPDIHLDELHFDTLKGAGVWRGEGPNALVFRRGESPNIALFNRGENLVFGLGGGRVYGLELRELNPDLGEYFSTDHGVLVLVVDDDSGLGLRPGDVIQSIGEREVEDPRDVFRILGSYEEDEAVTFTVIRHGEEARVEGTVR